VSRWQAGCGQKDAWEQQQENIQTGVSCAAAQAAKNDLLNQNSSSCYKATLDETSVMEALCGFFLMESFNLLSYCIKMLNTVVVKKEPGGLGSLWEGGRCGLPSVDNHDLV